MNLFRKTLAGAVCTAALLIASSSSAAVTGRFTGIISNGYDTQGVFGSPGGSLTGLGYTATFKYNPENGLRTTIPVSYDEVHGGTVHGVASPVLSYVLRINGIDDAFAMGYDSAVVATAGTSFYLLSNHFSASGQQYMGNVVEGAASGDLDSPIWTTDTVSGPGYGYAFKDDAGGSRLYYAAFDAQSVAFSVPEPTSWALMISGFGLAGAALRRRRAAVEA